MASPSPPCDLEGSSSPEKVSNPVDESGGISDTMNNGQEQSATESNDPPPVVQSPEGYGNSDSGGDPRRHSGENNPGSSSTQSAEDKRERANTELFSAVLDENMDALREAIQSGANGKATYLTTETALHLACRRGYQPIVEELLKHESILQCLAEVDNDGWTPLMSACSENRPGTKEIVELLLSHSNQFDIEARSNKDRTALHVACSESSEEVIQLLLDSNAEVNVCDHRNRTPLTIACETMSSKIVQSLLALGAKCDVADDDGDTPLILASRYGDPDMVREILAKNPDSLYNENKSGEDALRSAILNPGARDQTIPLLLNRGLQLTYEDALRYFPPGTFEKASGYAIERSMWVKVVEVVQKIQQTNRSPPDKSLKEAIGSIVEFASKQKKVSALLNADTKEHFDILREMTANLGLSEDICTLLWAWGRGEQEVQSLLQDSHLEDLAKEMLNVMRGGSAKMKQMTNPETQLQGSAKLTQASQPITRLQWSAYYGEYKLVWYLLKESQSKDKKDIRKALEIAKARKSTIQAKGKENLTQSNGGPVNEPESNITSHHEDPERFELTKDILINLPISVSLPEKLPERPTAAESRKREPLLQKHYANIVDFYEKDSQIHLLRSSPSVYDLIYEGENNKINQIMQNAKTMDHKIASGNASSEINENKTIGQTVEKYEQPRLRWIHLPANNMDWMEHLTLRIYDDESKVQEDKVSFFNLARQSRDELPTDTSDIKFMKPICLREAQVTLGQGKTKPSTESSLKETQVGSTKLALYVPYITFGYCYRSDEESSGKQQDELTKEYRKSIVHRPRSLDRFYYNALPEDKMQERDGSQVVTRGLLKMDFGQSPLKDSKYHEKWPYLSVDQLWLWVIDDKTIITSSTHRDDGFDELLINKIFKQLLEDNQKSMGQRPPSSATEMSHFLVSNCVDFINNLTWEDCDIYEEEFNENSASKPILLWYAESINKVGAQEKYLFAGLKSRIEAHSRHQANEASEKQTTLMTDFKKMIRKLENKVGQNEDQDKTEDTGKSKSPASESVEEDWKAMKKAATLLDEVKDIRDELVILRFLVTQQERVWEGLMGPYTNSHDARNPSFTAHELDDMIKMTERTQKSITYFMDTKQSMLSVYQSAALVELAKKADEQSAQNASQGKVLFIFTFVTVLFTPLSFVTSLLALNTSTSRHNDGGELEYEPGWMYRIIFGPTAGFFGLVLLYVAYAFYHDNLQKKLKKGSQRLISSPFWILSRIELMKTRNAKSRREDGRSNGRSNGRFNGKYNDRQGGDEV